MNFSDVGKKTLAYFGLRHPFRNTSEFQAMEFGVFARKDGDPYGSTMFMAPPEYDSTKSWGYTLSSCKRQATRKLICIASAHLQFRKFGLVPNSLQPLWRTSLHLCNSHKNRHENLPKLTFY
jgi:hypothetical protein